MATPRGYGAKTGDREQGDKHDHAPSPLHPFTPSPLHPYPITLTKLRDSPVVVVAAARG